MTEPRRLLVVAHSATGNVAALTDAVLRGALDPDISGVVVERLDALTAGADDVVGADALLLGTPANFGYMSGALKHFFDTVYHPCVVVARGRPFAIYVKGESDVSGALDSIRRITTGLGWREVQPPVAVVGDIESTDLLACEELGRVMGARLMLGLD